MKNACVAVRKMEKASATLIFATSIGALIFSGDKALADDEYFPTEPPLADSGWTVRYNPLLIACYQGDMGACDRIVSDPGMISGNAVYNYAATCGGRLDMVTARRLSAQMLENGVRGGMCASALVRE